MNTLIGLITYHVNLRFHGKSFPDMDTVSALPGHRTNVPDRDTVSALPGHRVSLSLHCLATIPTFLTRTQSALHGHRTNVPVTDTVSALHGHRTSFPVNCDCHLGVIYICMARWRSRKRPVNCQLTVIVKDLE